jgi:hypothetical protein
MCLDLAREISPGGYPAPGLRPEARDLWMSDSQPRREQPQAAGGGTRSGSRALIGGRQLTQVRVQTSSITVAQCTARPGLPLFRPPRKC